MTRKTIVITGAGDGIGAAAATLLAARRHHVVIVGCSPVKMEALAWELGASFYIADFTKLREVHTLAEWLLATYPRIDVLANNAGGVSGSKRRVTQDGHELTFQVNYLAGFLLTRLLLNRLIDSRATVINTASIGNRALGHLDIDDLENVKKYSPFKAFGDSKLAQVLFTRELYRRYGQFGLTAAAFHPGNTTSKYLWLESIEMGADTLAWLAGGQPGADFPPGEYFYRRKIAKPNRQAFDANLASKLWDRSETMLRGSEGLRLAGQPGRSPESSYVHQTL
jgi:NAD(P)-dependent dehydrogenase (short-subunit alcohol dehydrogenase family)